MYKNYIFDFNGTLIDDCDLCLDILNIITKEYNLGYVSKRKYKSIFTFPVYLYYKELGFDVTEESFNKVGGRFHELYNSRSYKEVKLFSDVIKVLNTLKEKGCKLICISASHIDTLKKQLTFYGIIDCFDDVIGLSDTKANGKLEEAKNYVSTSKINPKETLFIGDSIHDLEVANAINTDCYLVATGHTSKARLKKVTNNVIDRLSDILK